MRFLYIIIIGLVAAGFRGLNPPLMASSSAVVDRLASSEPGLFVSGMIFAHALLMLLPVLKKRQNSSHQIVESATTSLWFLMTMMALLCWPLWITPTLYPIEFFFFTATVLIFPIALFQEQKSSQWSEKIATKYERAILFLVAAVSVVSAVQYCMAAGPYIFSSDSMSYICHSRDLALDFPARNQNHYILFPGVYHFWQFLIGVSDGSWESLQRGYLFLLLINACFVGGIVYLTLRRLFWAVMCAIWYLVLISRFEGFMGYTEPAATFPYLIALILWRGQPLRERSGAIFAVVLGVGLGLTLFIKQQGGLLSLGAIVLLFDFLKKEKTQRDSIYCLLAIPLVAAITFLVAILAEGKGFQPLEIGLRYTAAYEAKESVLQNFTVLFSNDESLICVSALTLILWLIFQFSTRLRNIFGDNTHRLVGFVIVGAAFCTIQYFWRPYYHYMLLAIPGIVIGSSIFLVTIGYFLIEKFSFPKLLQAMCVSLAMVPLLWVDELAAIVDEAGNQLVDYHQTGNSTELKIWQIALPHDYAPHDAWHLDPIVIEELNILKSKISQFQTMFILPPRNNAPHLVLGTRTVTNFGYRWSEFINLREIDWSEFDYVLVLNEETESAEWKSLDCDGALQDVIKAGFRPCIQLQKMTVFCSPKQLDQKK